MQLLKIHILKLIIIFIIIGSSSTCVKAQEVTAQQIDSSMYYNPLMDDITEKIPPLEALIQMAVEFSPKMKLTDALLGVNYCDLKSSKRNWTKDFGIEAYGQYGNYFFEDKIENIQPNFVLSTSLRTVFAVSAYIRMPAIDIVNRNNEINKSKWLIEQNLAQRKQEELEIRQDVILQYNKLIQSQKLLRIVNEFQQYTLLQMQMAEREYLNGDITIAELTRLKDIEMIRAVEFQDRIYELYMAYDLLQELIGVRFNLINVIK
ncbi:MAG: TolC family protein [Bacteroidales bacterium]|nr:TolC family protein [Bacteroidales bacterium]